MNSLATVRCPYIDSRRRRRSKGLLPRGFHPCLRNLTPSRTTYIFGCERLSVFSRRKIDLTRTLKIFFCARAIEFKASIAVWISFAAGDEVTERAGYKIILCNSERGIPARDWILPKIKQAPGACPVTFWANKILCFRIWGGWKFKRHWSCVPLWPVFVQRQK